jgi:hypothetical protein
MIHDKLRSSSAPESPHASPAASSPHHPLLHKLSEAASALKAQQQLLLQKHQGNAKGPPALDSPGQGVDSFRVPVVYRQWHPEVTVLFADISSYTSLSTQVEPEQVSAVCCSDGVVQVLLVEGPAPATSAACAWKCQQQQFPGLHLMAA